MNVVPDGTICPGFLSSYVERLQDFCEDLDIMGVACSRFVLSFVLEDPIWWDEADKFHFMSKFALQVFNGMNGKKRAQCLRFMNQFGVKSRRRVLPLERSAKVRSSLMLEGCRMSATTSALILLPSQSLYSVFFFEDPVC